MHIRQFADPRAFAAGLVLCLLLAGSLQAAPFQGRIVKSEGQISVTAASGEAVDLGATNNVVRETQTIATGPNGRAVVSFNNGSITVLDPNSRLQVKTPNWFVHLAGKAFFTFKKLVGAADERRVQNTVALIGIRGTEFISYETDQTAIALDEGVLNLQTLGDAFEVSEDGAQSSVSEFILDAKQMVTFDGASASVGAFTPAVLADFTAIKVFGGDLLGDFSIDFTPDDAAAAAAAAAVVVVAEEEEPQEEPEPEQAAATDSEDTAEADDGPSGPGLYVGFGAGLSTSDRSEGDIESDLNARGHTVNSIEYDGEDTVGKAFLGYYITPSFGIELGYTNLGKFESTINATTSDANQFANDVAEVHPVSAEGYYVAGIAKIELVLFAITLKGGIYNWEGEVEASLASGTPVDTTRDGTDPMFGVGVELPLLPIRVELERYDLDGDAVDVVAASLVFQF